MKMINVYISNDFKGSEKTAIIEYINSLEGYHCSINKNKAKIIITKHIRGNENKPTYHIDEFKNIIYKEKDLKVLSEKY